MQNFIDGHPFNKKFQNIILLRLHLGVQLIFDTKDISNMKATVKEVVIEGQLLVSKSKIRLKRFPEPAEGAW